ncbi:hypothetical protein XH80_26520 [Bradyrhizobium sp. CCBAU 45384]|nr:hypothetical protein [Bradyrhizobium sp. CCBAU 45384]
MTFFWGAVGYIFGAFAPGYLIVRAFRIERLLPPLAGPFALSVIASGVMVESAVWFGIYTTAVARVIAGAVVAAALATLIQDSRLAFDRVATGARAAWCGLCNAVKPTGGRLQPLPLVSCLAAVLVFLYTLNLLAASFGSILVGYDPVAQWNLWALDWAANRLPNRIYHYPQLIPQLWSVPYVLMGDSTVEFFSSSFKFVFWLLTFETLAFVAVRSRDFVLLLSIPIAFVLMRWGIGGTSVQDFIDVPVAFFALLSTVTILLFASSYERPRAIALALLLASGAAMTKQVGLYMIGAVPLLCLCWTYEEKRRLAPVFMEGLALTWRTALAIALCAPIYVYAFVTIRNGSNSSELGYLFEGIYENRSQLTRAIDAITFVYALLGFSRFAVIGIGLAGFIALNVAVLFNARYRWILLAVNIPFSTLWAVYFSYDRRNLALALPLYALTSSAGAGVLLRRFASARERPLSCLASEPQPPAANRGYASRHGLAATIVAVASALVIGASMTFTAERMHQRQNAIELRMLAAEEPGPVEPMLSFMQQLGPRLMIFSEWRWACAFHFNRGAEKCLRITPDDFFRASSAPLAAHPDRPILLILYPATVTTDRERWMRDAGFVEKPVGAGAGVRCFVRSGQT